MRDLFFALLYFLSINPVTSNPCGTPLRLALTSHASQSQMPAQLIYLGLVIPVLGFLWQFAENGRVESFLTFGYQDVMPDSHQYLWGYTLLSYWFVLLVYCVAHEKMFVQFLEWAPLRYLGKISYGLYIYHFPIIWIIVLLQINRAILICAFLNAKGAKWANFVLVKSTLHINNIVT